MCFVSVRLDTHYTDENTSFLSATVKHIQYMQKYIRLCVHEIIQNITWESINQQWEREYSTNTLWQKEETQKLQHSLSVTLE